MDELLEIVIPAYSVRYLEDLLDSLCAQTCNNFKTLVVDDDSPENVADVCQRYVTKLHIRYVHFSPNFGRNDLMAHWNRAVRESSAPWIIVPGDDDMLDPNCVEAFYNELAQHGNRYDVYSFGHRAIDSDGKRIREAPSQDIDSAAQFLMRRFSSYIEASPVCYVFSMRAFERAGGFVSFPRGWHSDDASYALFSSRTGIKSITGAYASWRKHGRSLSDVLDTNTAASNTTASQQFLHWLRDNAATLALTERDLADIVNKVARQMGSIARYQSLAPWCRTVWQASGLLKDLGGRSRLLYLLKFSRWRWLD
jgi:glycosyltransferase involved in cell wall biosynthesis